MNKELNDTLLKAATDGNIRAIQKALKNGANLKAKNVEKLNALSLAAREGHLEVVQFLLDKKATVTNETVSIAEISDKSNIEIIKILQIAQMRQVKPKTKFNSTVDTQLLNSAYKGDLLKLKNALTRYGDPDAIDGMDTSALRWASRFNHKNIVDELLKAGAKVNLQSNTGWTALMEAIVAGSIEIVDVLIKNGADVNARTFVNATPLYFATERRIDEIIQLLKKNKAKYNPPGN